MPLRNFDVAALVAFFAISWMNFLNLFQPTKYSLCHSSYHNKNRKLLCPGLYVKNVTMATSYVGQDKKLGRQTLICVGLNTLPLTDEWFCSGLEVSYSRRGAHVDNIL